MTPLTPDWLGKLIDGHAAALELYGAQWTSSAGDVVQEAFVELIKQNPCPDQPIAWLYRVVRNRAFNAARAESRRRRHEQAIANRQWFTNQTQVNEVDAEEAADALAQLPVEQREIIVARIWGELTLRQIADLTETSVATVHRRYQAGIQTLRERLTGSWLTNERPQI